MKFFKKEILSRPISTQKGERITFEDIGGNRGVRVLDESKDGYLIEQLSTAAKRHVGGVVELTEAEFIELKKNNSGTRQQRKSNPFDGQIRTQPALGTAEAALGVSAEKPAGGPHQAQQRPPEPPSPTGQTGQTGPAGPTGPTPVRRGPGRPPGPRPQTGQPGSMLPPPAPQPKPAQAQASTGPIERKGLVIRKIKEVLPDDGDQPPTAGPKD